MKYLRKTICLILVFVLLIGFGCANIKQSLAISVGDYVTILSSKQNVGKGTVTVKYKVKKLFPYGSLRVGVEHPTTTRVKGDSILIKKKGTFTKTFNLNAMGYYRSYVQLTVRNYTSKKISKTELYQIKTGKSYHTVTAKEEKAHSIGTVVIGGVISLVGIKCKPIIMAIAGIGFSASITLKNYNPRKGDYIVTTTSRTSSTKFSVKIAVYYSKENYMKKKKAFQSWSNTIYLSNKYPKF